MKTRPPQTLDRTLALALTLLTLAACGGDSPDDSPVDDATADGTEDTAADLDVDPGDSDPEASETADADDTADTDVPTLPELLTPEQVFDAVDPMIGTGGIGFGYAALTPAAQLPNGFVKLGPDSTYAGSHAEFNHFSGYYAFDPHVRGFSHTHLVGTGTADLGNLRVFPTRTVPERPWNTWTTLDRTREHAEPGYYEAWLPDEAVHAELTAGEFVGAHRYTFEGDGPRLLVIDFASSVEDSGVLEASGAFADGVLTSDTLFKGGYVGRQNAFRLLSHLEFSEAPVSVRFWTADATDLVAIDGVSTRAGAILDFGDGTAPFSVAVGLSLGGATALANLDAGTPDRDFDTLRAAAKAAWLEVFSRVRFGDPDPTVVEIFSTALYNAHRMPSRLSESNGRYAGTDGAIHEVDWDGDYYSDLSLWDTFRTLHPWYALVAPDLQRDCLHSLVAMYDQIGLMPRWPAMTSETRGMLGASANMLFAESALKGIDGVDYAAAFDRLVASDYGVLTNPEQRAGRETVGPYVELGYVPSDLDGASVSLTLEYAWADAALANLATWLGRDATVYEARARSFENLWDAETGFFLPKDSAGVVDRDFEFASVFMNGEPYREGSAWHYRFYGVTHPTELAALFGSNEALAAAAEEFFVRSALGQPGIPNLLLPDPYYWHSNEPALHTAWVPALAGAPDRTAHWVREIQTRLYNPNEDGLAGNDDGGTLSAWYLFSALGFYPVAGTDWYVVGAPLVDRAELVVTDGSTLRVEAPGADTARRYVSSATVDDAPLGAVLEHSQLSGATLRFELSETP